MASKKQIRANRKNAQKSGGPGDTSNSRHNRTFHGLRGSRVVLPHEDINEYNAMAASLYNSFQPVGTYEHNLVKIIADRTWELERVANLKMNTLTRTEYRDVMMAEMEKWEMYQGRIERAIIRARKELFALQQARGQAYNPEAHDSEETPILCETEVFVGPSVGERPSQGEVAIENFTQVAVRKMRAQWQTDNFNKAINQRADLYLQHQESEDPQSPAWEGQPDSDKRTA